MENMEKKINKDILNEFFQDKLNNFIKLLNQNNLDINLLDDDIIVKIKEIINGSFILQNEEYHNEDKNLKKFEDINNCNNIYLNLIKLFTQIKFCYILKRFKNYDKQYLLETQKYNINKNKNGEKENEEININNSKILFNPNEDIDEMKILHSDTTIEENENENQIKGDDIDLKISKKKDYNDRIQSYPKIKNYIFV